jgi:nucleotide-binding universal stress UspA family protein
MSPATRFPKEGAQVKLFAYIDRSAFAGTVCDYAAWAARQLGTTVELIHAIDHPTSQNRDYSGHFVIDAPETVLEERVRVDEAHNRLLIEEGRLLLEAAAAGTAAAGAPHVVQRLFQGTVVEHLQHHYQEATLVVVGKRGEGAGLDPHHLGRNLERIVRSAHRPVLIAGADFTPVKRALIAWDGGRSAGEAIHFLANQPLLSGVGCTLLHASSDERSPAGATDAVRHLQAAHLDVALQVVPGSPAKAIVEACNSEAADLLVMGAFGHSRIRSLIIGSTTTEVLLNTSTSVLVFH